MLPTGASHIRRGISSTYIEQNNEQDACNNINNEQHRMTLNYRPSLAIKKARGSSSAYQLSSAQLSAAAAISHHQAATAARRNKRCHSAIYNGVNYDVTSPRNDLSGGWPMHSGPCESKLRTWRWPAPLKGSPTTSAYLSREIPA